VRRESAARPKFRCLALPAVVAALLSLTSCQGMQHSLDPRGPAAERIAVLWWIMLGVSAVIMLAVTVLTIVAVLRSWGNRPETSLTRGQSTWLVLLGGVLIPIVVLFGLLVYSVSVSNALWQPLPEDDLTIEVVGIRWWWQVHYLQPGRGRIATTANEIHIPTGRRIRVMLKSADVIHSFWVPNLHGKTDMIPGQVNGTWLQADQPGTFRGQCAEFCGLQHAHMAFVVVAKPPEEFEDWLAGQTRPAREPTEPEQIRGREVFLNTTCVMCHAIRGTVAMGQVAPDLTHMATRRTLAAGTLANNRGNLVAWIVDPQRIKPGNFMPPTNLGTEDLHALVSYLESLD
jgi:cytochrome c oxidase subunit II